MKEVFIERDNNSIRIAVKKDKAPIMFYIEEDNELFPGQIYKGTVKNIVPGIKGAFVDIGTSENVFMSVDYKLKNINLKKGDEVIVEILKDKEENKKAKVTSAFSLPGRYVVLNTLNKTISFSSKIKDKDFISKIENIVEVPEEFGFVIRTNAEGVDTDDVLVEINKIKELYYKIINKAKFSRNNGLIYDAGGIIEKVLRDVVDENTTKIYSNDENDYNFIKDYIEAKSDMSAKIEIHNNERTLFHYYNLDEEVLNLFNKKIPLPNGGFIVIDNTEAMHVIDVNSGKNVKGSNIKETGIKINLEAAKEIAKQIVLRNIGGIIVVDFIDMKNIEDKKIVLKELQNAFEEVNDKVVLYPFTQLNLVQIVRRKRGKSILDSIQDKCNSCMGSGSKVKFSYLNTLIRNEIIKYKKANNINEFMISINDYYKEYIEGSVEEFISKINGENSIIYLNYIIGDKLFGVEPILYDSQRKSYNKFKIYG